MMDITLLLLLGAWVDWLEAPSVALNLILCAALGVQMWDTDYSTSTARWDARYRRPWRVLPALTLMLFVPTRRISFTVRAHWSHVQRGIWTWSWSKWQAGRTLLICWLGCARTGDLKPENVLLKADANAACKVVAKITDFGLSITIDPLKSHVR